jgi:hypothetical protein
MKRVMYITRTNLQLARSSGKIETYRGIVGENAEVPDDIAVLLVARGEGVLVVSGKPTLEPATDPPPAEKAASPPAKRPARPVKRRR